MIWILIPFGLGLVFFFYNSAHGAIAVPLIGLIFGFFGGFVFISIMAGTIGIRRINELWLCLVYSVIAGITSIAVIGAATEFMFVLVALISVLLSLVIGLLINRQGIRKFGGHGT
jgi:cobalamin synthase